MALTQISTGGIKDDAVTDAKLPANSVGNSEMKDDAVGVAELSATGTASSSTFLRGDNSWVTPTDTNTQLSTEQVQDIVGAMFTGNTETNITATYEDSDGTIDLVSTDTNTQLSTEQVQDIVGAMFTGNTETNITATYEDSDGTIDLVSTDTNTQLSTEEVQDIVGAMFSGNTETNITATYEDSDGTIDLVSTDTVYTHPNHSGEVTSTADGATVIADDIVDEANLKIDNAPTNDYVLTAKSSAAGGLTWAEASGGGATGGGSDKIFHENGTTVTTNYTITNNMNAGTFGPVTINNGVTVTVGDGEYWTVV